MTDPLALLAQSGPLAIAPRYLGYMLSVLRGHAAAQPLRQPTLGGRPIAATTLIDGIAVVPVAGPILQRTDAFASIFGGAVSVADLQATMAALLEEPAIRGILLAIDSPGGEVAGVADLAKQLYAARGTKPMLAAADEAMYSAAYWLGSAVGPVTVPQTGGVGSIGALVVHTDLSGALEQMGVRMTVVKSGAKKAMFSPFQALSTEARDTLQTEVDRVAGLFIDAVAQHRGLDASTVREFEAGTFEGPAAVRAGLADRVQSLDEAFASLQAQIQSGERRERMSKMADQNPIPDGKAEADLAKAAEEGRQLGKAQIYDLQKAHEEAKQKACAAAIEKERQRAAEITRWCAFAGKPDLAEGYLASDLTLEQVRNELLNTTAGPAFEIESARGTTPRRPVLTYDEIYGRRREQVLQARRERAAF